MLKILNIIKLAEGHYSGIAVFISASQFQGPRVNPEIWLLSIDVFLMFSPQVVWFPSTLKPQILASRWISQAKLVWMSVPCDVFPAHILCSWEGPWIHMTLTKIKQLIKMNERLSNQTSSQMGYSSQGQCWLPMLSAKNKPIFSVQEH